MLTIKKVQVVPLDENYGKIIDSFNTQDDKTKNAPSLNAVENYVEAAKTDLETIRSETLTMSGEHGSATIVFTRVGRVVQVTATMTAAASDTNTYVLTFIESGMPEWAKIKNSDTTVELLNLSKVGNPSDMTSYINLNYATSLEFLKGSTNRYSFRFNIFKSSNTGELSQTLTGCYITDLDE